MHDLQQLMRIWIKFFFLLTPFFALSVFLSITGPMASGRRQKTALLTTAAVIVICYGLFFFGNQVFNALGITLNAFRVGAGSLLFLSAVALVRGTDRPTPPDADEDVAVVPLALPVTVGPATTGALLVMGAESGGGRDRLLGCVGLALAVLCVGVILLAASLIERLLRRRGIQILSKLTGVVLAAMAAQMVLTGVKNFFAA